MAITFALPKEGHSSEERDVYTQARWPFFRSGISPPFSYKLKLKLDFAAAAAAAAALWLRGRSANAAEFSLLLQPAALFDLFLHVSNCPQLKLGPSALSDRFPP